MTDARGHILQSKYVPRNSNIYNAKTKLYTYRVGNLTQKSKYDVTITALYGNLASKEAKGKIQTTLLPASYRRLDDSIKADPYYEGGVTITAPIMGTGILRRMPCTREMFIHWGLRRTSIMWEQSMPRRTR